MDYDNLYHSHATDLYMVTHFSKNIDQFFWTKTTIAFLTAKLADCCRPSLCQRFQIFTLVQLHDFNIV